MENAGVDGFNEFLNGYHIILMYNLSVLLNQIIHITKKYWWQYISNLYRLSLVSITPVAEYLYDKKQGKAHKYCICVCFPHEQLKCVSLRRFYNKL